MEFKWNIVYDDFLEYKKMMKDNAFKKRIREYIRERAIEEKAYYEGFKPAKEKVMFKEELADVEKMYASTKQEMLDKIKDVSPTMIYYMKKFIEAYEQGLDIQEKIDILNEKLGRETEKTCCEEE